MTAILGKDASGKTITIDKAERREGLYIIGSSGTGKSTLLTSLIQQDIRDNIGVCVADPHGDLIQRTIELMPPEKYKDVILLDVANPLYVFGLNIFHCENPQDLFAVENVISGVMHILDKVYNISNLTPQMNQYFLNITQTLLYNAPLSILDVPRLFSDKKFRLKLASNVPNTQVRWFWNDFFENRAKFRRDDEMSAVSNKLDDFFRPALKTIFGQEITTINMRKIMDDPAGKILLVKMNARWESITKILGSVIVSQILDAAYSRSDIPIKKRRQFHLYADEFQWFASQDFSTLFSEARKYGIGLTIAHQTLEQVDPHIIATCKQAKTIISFRVSGENAESLATQFDTTPPEPKMEEAGRRKKQTPVKDVINHLRTGGEHFDPAVNDFAIHILQAFPNHMIAQDEKELGVLNTLLYKAMIGTPIDQLMPSARCILTILLHLDSSTFGIVLSPWQTSYIPEGEKRAGTYDAFIRWWQGDASALAEIEDEVRLYLRNSRLKDLCSVLRFRVESHYREYLFAIANPKYNANYELIHTRFGAGTLTPDQWAKHEANNGFRQAVLKIKEDFFKETAFQWFHIDITELEWEKTDETYTKYIETHDRTGSHSTSYPLNLYRIVPGQEEKFYTQEDLQKIIDIDFQKAKITFVDFIYKLKGTMQGLAEKPILADSGEEEVVYRPGQQQTHADKQAEIANMLTRLPNMTAYARIAGQEHTITVNHSQPNGKRSPLAHVMQTITEWNLEDGYIRSRADVEKEIEARQNHPDEPPPPQSTPQPAKPKPKIPSQAPSPTAAFLPFEAIWKTKTVDLPVTIIGIAGTHNGVTYYLSKGSGTGIPENEIVPLNGVPQPVKQPSPKMPTPRKRKLHPEER